MKNWKIKVMSNTKACEKTQISEINSLLRTFKIKLPKRSRLYIKELTIIGTEIHKIL